MNRPAATAQSARRMPGTDTAGRREPLPTTSPTTDAQKPQRENDPMTSLGKCQPSTTSEKLTAAAYAAPISAATGRKTDGDARTRARPSETATAVWPLGNVGSRPLTSAP